MNLKLAFFCLLLLIGLPGCDPTHDVGGFDSGDPSFLSQIKLKLDQPEQLVFADVQDLVFSERCLECHNSRDKKDNISLSTFGEIFGPSAQRKIIVPYEPERSSLMTSLLVPSGKRHMPPFDKPQLEPEQIELVRAWIKYGAKMTATDRVEREPSLKEQLAPYYADPGTVDYQVVQKFLFESSCIKCHSKDSEGVDRDVLRYSANLTNYQTLFHPALTVVKKGHPEESSIFKAIAIHQSMPPSK
ncbi:MAG: c-type cytochrome, partial [Bdellovibrionales bacterium]|nr:c-type cytochrome [Bdellovibrionales bacterium]